MHDEGTLLFRTKYTYVPTHNKLGVEVDGFAVSGKMVGFVGQY